MKIYTTYLFILFLVIGVIGSGCVKQNTTSNSPKNLYPDIPCPYSYRADKLVLMVFGEDQGRKKFHHADPIFTAVLNRVANELVNCYVVKDESWINRDPTDPTSPRRSPYEIKQIIQKLDPKYAVDIAVILSISYVISDDNELNISISGEMVEAYTANHIDYLRKKFPEPIKIKKQCLDNQDCIDMRIEDEADNIARIVGAELANKRPKDESLAYWLNFETFEGGKVADIINLLKELKNYGGNTKLVSSIGVNHFYRYQYKGGADELYSKLKEVIKNQYYIDSYIEQVGRQFTIIR
ncbi:hypothetical protein GMMP15_80053 [Candidatus Magnetomoraceae bacterium gMMP-15]